MHAFLQINPFRIVSPTLTMTLTSTSSSCDYENVYNLQIRGRDCDYERWRCCRLNFRFSSQASTDYLCATALVLETGTNKSLGLAFAFIGVLVVLLLNLDPDGEEEGESGEAKDEEEVKTRIDRGARFDLHGTR